MSATRTTLLLAFLAACTNIHCWYSRTRYITQNKEAVRIALALRWRLLLLWLFMLLVSGALAYLIRDVYQLGSEAQAQKSLEQVSQACDALQAEYTNSIKPEGEVVDAQLMHALLNLILDKLPGIEGGFWHETQGFVAYAFPTHAGSEEKKDMPSTERNRIETLARKSIAEGAALRDLIAGSRETVVLTGCPVDYSKTHLVAWTMMRSPMADSKAYDNVNRGLGLLFAFVIISGIWLSLGFFGWSKRFNLIERELAGGPDNAPRKMAATGDVELDRVVAAFNQFRAQLDAERARTIELGTLLERSERFTALGRMAAAVAHEVRNPIAAMQLKAENALARPEDQRTALEFILREIGRLDETVKELLKKTEPVSIHSRQVHIADWLMERVDAFTERSAAAEIDLRTRIDIASWSFDPRSLGRALDNLIANALQHTPRGGVVTVTASKNAFNAAMVLQVCDTGPGVAADMEPRLFEPFVSGRPDGIGLGLALAREIAVAHGGEARYFRQSSGTCFELEIPWHVS